MTTEERESILTSDMGNLLLDTVAPIYDKSIITLWIFQAFGITLADETEFVTEASSQYIDSFIAQIFPQTVTWGISLWEEEYGIVPDSSKTLQQRREYLRSVMYTSNAMTPYRIQQIILGVTGLPCRVIENTAPNTITILISGYYPNMTEVKTELNRKLPAHIAYDVRMAEQTETNNLTSTAFAITTFEKYETEVLN